VGNRSWGAGGWGVRQGGGDNDFLIDYFLLFFHLIGMNHFPYILSHHHVPHLFVLLYLFFFFSASHRTHVHA
jgi:hypothetical protein